MTGIEGLDKVTGGFLSGELVNFTAETDVGKTLLAQQTRLYARTSGIHTLFASAEMDVEHLLSRDLPTAAGVRRFKLRQSEKLNREDLRALLEAAAHQCEHCRVLDGAISIARIRRTARQMRNSRGLDLIIIDYDELVEARGDTELDQQRNVAVGAKRLAVEFRIPVIVISQLRKLLKGEVRPVCDRLGIPRFGWHSCRHSFTTYGGNSGVPLPVLQSGLGHTSAETTMIYTHPLVEAQRRVVEELAAILFANAPHLDALQWPEPLRWHDFFVHSFRFGKSVLASSSRGRDGEGDGD